MTEHLKGDSSDSQSAVILEMERKLNPVSFWRRLRGRDNYATLTTSQYWNLLVYIDVSLIRANCSG
jgi:hypothetical protein